MADAHVDGPRQDAAVRAVRISLSRSRAIRLDGAPAGKQLEDQHDQREDEKDVDERADRWERDDAEQPEDQQHDDDRPEHDLHLLAPPGFARRVPSVTTPRQATDTGLTRSGNAAGSWRPYGPAMDRGGAPRWSPVARFSSALG